MSDKVTALPSAAGPRGLGVPADIPTHDLPLTLRIMLDPVMFQRVKDAATIMSGAEGFIGAHLAGKAQACFAVITRSMDWKLDPYFVAQATYQTPNGAVGFEGKLCQAILENSGRFIGGIKFQHKGDWSKITGRFKLVKNAKGHDIPTKDWPDADEKGLGVTVIGQVRGEDKPREWSIDLVQAYPRNSPLWATDPRSQICYLAVRRFGDLAAPGIYGGVRFNIDEYLDASEAARDVTPPLQTAAAPGPTQDTRSVVDAETETDEDVWEVYDAEGECVALLKTPQAFADAVVAILNDAAKKGIEPLDIAWSNNTAMVQALAVHDRTMGNDVAAHMTRLKAEIAPKKPARAPRPAAAASAAEPAQRTAPEATPAPPEEPAPPAASTAVSDAARQADDGWPGPDTEARGNEDAARQADLDNPTEATTREPTRLVCPLGGVCSFSPEQCANGLSCQRGPEDNTAAQEPAKASADPFWSGPLDITPPQRPKGGVNWPAYADRMVQLVSTAPNAEAVVAFRRANQRNLSNLRLSYAGGHEEFEEAAKARG
jgi:hypothetical protein